MAKPPSAITGIANFLPTIMRKVSRKERVYTEDLVVGCFRFYARQGGLDVRDLSLVDTVPLFSLVCPWLASLPTSEREFDDPFPTSNELEEIRSDTVPPGTTDSDSSVPP